MANQNPLSYVAPGVSAGAATVLPSKPFDPQAFFAELIGQKKAEHQLELKKRDDIEQHNLSWANRMDKLKQDWWDRQDNYFSEKAQGLLDEMTDIALEETADMKKVGVEKRAYINRKLIEFNHEVAASKKMEQETGAIEIAARQTPGVMFSEEGLAKMWEDVDNGTFSISKRNTDYLLSEKNWGYVTDDDIAKDIATLIGTYTETQKNRNVKNPTAEAIKLAQERANQTNSDMNRYLNYLVKKGAENGGITEEQKQERFKSIMNSAIASIDTSNTEKSAVTYNFGVQADPSSKKSDWVMQPSEVIFTNMKSGSSYVTQAVGSLPIAGSLQETVDLEQGTMKIQEISIVPQAIVDIPIGTITVKAGSPISKRALELMKKNGIDKYLGSFSYYPYIVGQLDGKKTIVPLTDKNNGLLIQGSLRKKENIAWDKPEYDKVMTAIRQMNLLSEKAKHI